MTDDDAAIFAIDRFLPTWDEVIRVHRVVEADPATTFAAARDLNLLTLHSRLLDASFFVRDLPRRLARRAAPAFPERLTFTDEHGLPGWMQLAVEPDREIAFGAVEVFWTPTIVGNETVTRATFASFTEPGWGKIACNFSVLAFGELRSLLTYECRTLTTDAASRARFERYWWLIRPFVRHIMGVAVEAIRAGAEQAARA